ncbi:MAG TPA: T9SS type A sorting domain-containing protein, partial [Cryomorphaceae bacterium]|nr:T9SS type A sorting domain-containing protein [Cryomorphaceae bacterium]
GGYIVGGDYASAELDFGGTTITNDFTPDTDLFIAKLDVPLSVANRGGVELINVYPNPTSDFIQIDLNGTDARIDQISIFDVTGKMVLQENNTAGQFIQIEVSNLPQGQYTALLQSGMITYVSKFIKQN